MQYTEDVQKGLGTLLRELWKKHQDETEEFLLKWKDDCGRLIIRYATEKMDKENKKRFKKSKQFVSRTSRKAGIQLIKDKGRTEFVNYMVENKFVSIKKV